MVSAAPESRNFDRCGLGAISSDTIDTFYDWEHNPADQAKEFGSANRGRKIP